MQMRVHCEREVLRVAAAAAGKYRPFFHLPAVNIAGIDGTGDQPACTGAHNALITAKFTGTIPVWTWNTAHRGEHSDGRRETCNRC